MRTYQYPVLIEAGENSGFVASFPDVSEAITEGSDRSEVEAMASDALGVALLTYLELGRSVPKASASALGQVMVSARPETCAKLALIEAFQDSNLTQAELARRLGKDLARSFVCWTRDITPSFALRPSRSKTWVGGW